MYCGPFAGIIIENFRFPKKNKLVNSVSHGEHEGLPPASLFFFFAWLTL
jgi:hypothetical protein